MQIEQPPLPDQDQPGSHLGGYSAAHVAASSEQAAAPPHNHAGGYGGLYLLI